MQSEDVKCKECFLCQKIYKNYSIALQNIEHTHVLHSRKPIKSVLLHLSKFMKSKLELPPASYICQVCFQDLVQYDEFVVKLLTMQQRLTQMLEKSVARYGKSNAITKLDDENEELLNLSDLRKLPTTNISTLGSVGDDDMEDEILSVSDITDGLKDEESSADEFETSASSATVMETTAEAMKCPHCDLIIKNKTRLKYHINHEHKKKTFSCVECGITVRDEEYLDLHMNIHQGKSEKECRYCSKRYTRKVNVIRHMQKHWNKEKFQCEKCGLRFSETTKLYNHRLQHEAEDEPLICAICKQSFKTKRTYKGHMLTHQPDRPRFSCTHCAKTFVEKYTLKVHLRVHEGGASEKDSASEKRSAGSEEAKVTMTCIICGYGFSSKEQYNQHMEKEHDVILKT